MDGVVVIKQLHLLCGMSFSGKSTLGREIVKQKDYLYISLDDINAERGLVFGGQGIPPNEWVKTHEIAINRLKDYMKTDRDIIIDDTNCFKFLRDNYKEAAAKFGYTTTVIFIEVTLDELMSRMNNNEKQKVRESVKPEIFKELYESFQYPTEEENVKTYKANEDVSDWINKNL